MKKTLLVCLSMSMVLLTGCIGRRVQYDNQQPVKISSKSIDKPSQSNPVNNYGTIVYEGYKAFILKTNPKIGHDLAVNIANIVNYYSKEYSLDPKLVLALISRESSFRVNVISSSGAIGLGQLLKDTAKDMGVNDPYDPEENIKATSKYLALMIKKWNGNVTLALASYKIGHGNVSKILKAGNELPDSAKKYINDIMIVQSKIQDRL